MGRLAFHESDGIAWDSDDAGGCGGQPCSVPRLRRISRHSSDAQTRGRAEVQATATPAWLAWSDQERCQKSSVRGEEVCKSSRECGEEGSCFAVHFGQRSGAWILKAKDENGRGQALRPGDAQVVTRCRYP